ncbi:MAG: hypothetical protein KJO98_03920, partial [Rhodothermia bacterium]|nr:hypothetical protein [Rhodothermia bacterium]
RKIELGVEVRSIVEDDNGDFWLGTRNEGVRALDGEMLLLGAATPVFEGLNSERVSALRILGQVHFVTQEGIASALDDATGSIIPSTLHELLRQNSLSDTLRFAATDSRGLGWLVLPDAVVQVWLDRGAYRLMKRPVLHFDGIVQSRIAVEESGVAWISRGDELFRYDPHVVKDYDVPFSALIRKVVDSRTDSVLFGGNHRTATGGISAYQLGEDIPSFGYEFNNLRFRFAAPTFNSPEQTLYQYRLVGRSQEWSEWSRTSTVAFSSLREGSYTLEVRAKNAMGFTSDVGSYSFHLLPPWFRTWWAYSIYVLSLVTVSVLSWKYIMMLKAHRIAREQARELARERVVNERLNEANTQLQVANERLTKVNNLKDEFLATTSHELRTPITAILGYASILKEEVPGDYHEFVEIIEKSGARLMDTLNSLLDLAELRAGTVELTVDDVDIGALLADVGSAFKIEASNKGLSLELNIPNRPVHVRSDRGLIEKVVRILIGNAIKFTQSGSVAVSASLSVDSLRLSVSDTGEGIDEEFIPLLFDEFQQESGGLARSHGGNGLGLAIAAKVVELLQGTIHVESEKGIGSTFSILLPSELVPGSEMEDRLADSGREEHVAAPVLDPDYGHDEESLSGSEHGMPTQATEGELSSASRSSAISESPTNEDGKGVFEQDRPAVAKTSRNKAAAFDRRPKRRDADNQS